MPISLEKPRGVPDGRDPRSFQNRKGLYSINAQIVGGIDRRIYDILLGSPGSFHDAAIWGMSEVRGWFETKYPRRYVLGDSAYAQSDCLMTPYPEEQSRRDDLKCLLNVRHSGARVEMTENIYGMLKRRFPFIKFSRVNVDNLIKVTTATAVLHNLALDFADEMPEDNHPGYVEEPDEDQPDEDLADLPVQLVNELNPRERRAQAQAIRDRWMEQMGDRITASDMRQINIHRVQAEARRRGRR